MHSTVQSRRSRTISPLRTSAPFHLGASDSKMYDSLYSTWQSVGSYSQDTFDTLDRSPLYSGYDDVYNAIEEFNVDSKAEYTA